MFILSLSLCLNNSDTIASCLYALLLVVHSFISILSFIYYINERQLSFIFLLMFKQNNLQLHISIIIFISPFLLKFRPSLMTCFNCLGDHHMKDCPEKIDRARINANKKEILLSGSAVYVLTFLSFKLLFLKWSLCFSYVVYVFMGFILFFLDDTILMTKIMALNLEHWGK